MNPEDKDERKDNVVDLKTWTAPRPALQGEKPERMEEEQIRRVREMLKSLVSGPGSGNREEGTICVLKRPTRLVRTLRPEKEPE